MTMFKFPLRLMVHQLFMYSYNRFSNKEVWSSDSFFVIVLHIRKFEYLEQFMLFLIIT